MTRLIFYSGLILLTVINLTSCDVVDELTKFEMDYDTEVIIESTTALDLPFNVFSPDVETNSESEFSVNDTRKDLIEDIRLREMVLTITTPDGEDFSFLESMSIFISAEDFPELEIANIGEVPDNNSGTIVLDIIDNDIQDYIKADVFNLRLNTVTDEIITSDYRVEVSAVFFVDAKILGI